MNSGKIVYWVCDKDGCHWRAMIRDRVRTGKSCHFCQGRSYDGTFSRTTPELMGDMVIDGTRWDDLTPEQQSQHREQAIGKVVNVHSAGEVHPRSKKKVIWRCSIGHEMEQAYYRRVDVGGCHVCTRKPRSKQSLSETHYAAELVEPRHGALSVSSKVKIPWRCSSGHQWTASPATRTHENSTGCPLCYGRLVPGVNELSRTHPELADQLSDQSLRDTLTASGALARDWQCPQGHKFRKSVKKMIRLGCPWCSGRKLTPGVNDFATVWPDLVPLWSANNDREPSQFTRRSGQEVLFNCSTCGTEFTKKILHFAKNPNCPDCTKKGSRKEAEVRSIFEELTGQPWPSVWPEFLTQDNGYRMELDGYCEQLSAAFEFNGDYWHSEEFSRKFGNGVIERDELKRHLCEERGVSLLVITEDHWDQLSTDDRRSLVERFLGSLP